MASKIFMGDIPELLENILINLNNEFYSLYSCALVNRYWCKITIPILWKNPFSFNKNSLFISQYFLSLDENEKSVLKEYGINIKFPDTLFNYARFLKVLDLSSLESKVKKWIEFQHICWYYSPLCYYIINLLFKLFVESGATLHKLNIYFHEFKPEIYYSLERNEQFFSQLQDLSLRGISDYSIENATILLKILAKNVTKISALELEYYYDYGSEVNHALTNIIKSQEQLRKFTLVSGGGITIEYFGIISALESQKKSLQEVILENSADNAEFKVLMNCKNLETFRIKYCKKMKLLKILDTSHYKINTLEITDCLNDTPSIIQILEKIGLLLQRLKLDFNGHETLLLLKALKSFCPNITHLDISLIEFPTQLLEFIGSLQKLQFLTLWHYDCIPKEEIKIRVNQFAEILPLTLQYIDLGNTWLNLYIDIWLNNCYAPLKSLLVDSLNNEKKANAIIEFCIRKRTLKYVGLSNYSSLDDDDIKKEVEGYVTLVPSKDIIVIC
ncbi:hypothetical protein C2G38_2238337 [Gigaspora rosea]|uniref:Uncharacterized protein n=1 Tax=Gigaspora rosea TaxID=44941 RepID=A0A397W6C3_9GLOM|nr:hypothetical protein C2G38_2238337 [Gigaspora rosea]